jgi:hypothetical protein
MKKTISRVLATLATGLLFASTASASVLTTKVNADDLFEVFISTSDSVQGTKFGGAAGWETTYTNTTTLDNNTNYYLHIVATDTGGIAGLLGSFALTSGHHFANGLSTLNTGSSNWLANATGFNGAYTSVTDLGVNGVSPWGLRTGVSSEARWIWSGDASANNVSYFSTRIEADAPANVPEPGSLALLGLGLLGMTRLRKKA